MAANPRTRARVELVHHLDAHAWPERNRAGEVPNRYPFGLDELADHGIDVDFRPAVPRGLREKVLRRVRERCHEVEWGEAVLSIPGRWRGADIVLCWDEFTGIPAAELARVPGHPPVLTGVQMLANPERWPEPLLHRAGHALRRADGVFVQSECMVGPLVDDWGLEAERVHYVPFGIDASWFRPGLVDVDRDLVVSVGDDPARDYDTLIDAVTAVRSRRPGTRLEVATYLDVSLPAELGLVHRVHLGSRRPTFYGHAAVVAMAAHPNLHGSGMSVILEAMACGRPYVVTAGEGLAEYLADGVDGIVVPPGDTDAMAEAVTELLSDPDRADAMGAAGRRRVEEHFTTGTQARHLAAVIADMRSRHGAPR